MEKKVGLLIIGAAKCATTTLYAILKSHPQLCGSKKKEPHFFSKHENWREELAWYHSLFDPCPGQLLFEASPGYSGRHDGSQKISQDIYEYNPEMKLIYLVRNPRERIASAYMHRYQRYRTDLDLHSSLTQIPSLLIASRYFTQIRPFIDKFGRDQVLIIDFDDFVQDKLTTLEKISAFLGIHAELFDKVGAHMNRSLDNKKYHHKLNTGLYRILRKKTPFIWKLLTRMYQRKMATKPRLSISDQKMILETLENEIDQLEMLMGKSLQHWKIIKDQY